MTLSREKIKAYLWEARKKQAGKRLEDAKAVIQEALVQAPDSGLLLGALADLEFRSGRMKEAEQLALEVLKDAPHIYDGLKIMGEINYKRRKYQEALSYFMEAERSWSNDYVLSWQARCLIRLDRPAEARTLLEKGLKANPGNPHLLQLMGKAQENLGRGDMAEQTLASAVRLAPHDGRMVKELMMLRLKELPLEEAAEELKNILKVPSEAKRSELWDFLGDILRKGGDFQGAAEAYRESLKQQPDNTYIMRNLGFACSKAQDYQGAAEALREPFLDNPHNNAVWNTLEKAHRKLGDGPGLMELVHQAMERHPTVAKLHGLLIRAEKISGGDPEK